MAKTMAMVHFHTFNTMTYVFHLTCLAIYFALDCGDRILCDDKTITPGQMLYYQTATIVFSFALALMSPTTKLSKHRPQTRILSSHSAILFLIFAVMIFAGQALTLLVFHRLQYTSGGQPSGTTPNLVDCGHAALTVLFLYAYGQIATHAFVCGLYDRFRTRFGYSIYTAFLCVFGVFVLLLQMTFRERDIIGLVPHDRLRKSLQDTKDSLHLVHLSNMCGTFLKCIVPYFALCAVVYLSYASLLRRSYHPDRTFARISKMAFRGMA